MEQQGLDRVRADLATMKVALGGPAFGSVDVGFFVAFSLAAGLFAVSQAAGANAGWALWLSRAPAILVFVVYMGYIAVRSRRNSPLNVTHRHEYRTTLLILPPIVAAALWARRWSASAGMTHLQFGGVLLVVVGCGLIVMGATNVRPSRYSRAYLLAAGLPMIAAGLICPFCTQSQGTLVVSCLAAVVFAAEAFVIQHDLRRQNEEAADAAD